MTHSDSKHAGWNSVVTRYSVRPGVFFSWISSHEMLLQFHARTKFRTSMQSGIWCSVFIQVQVSGNRQSGSGHSIFFQNQASDNHAVRNWMFRSGNNRIVLSQADVSDAVRNSKPIFFSSHNFWPSCSQELICWFLQQPHKLEVPWDPRHLSAMSRRFAGKPPPLSTHPSGKYWVNLLLWRHLGTKAKERPAAMSFPHQRNPYVRNFTRPLLLAEPRHDSARPYKSPS